MAKDIQPVQLSGSNVLEDGSVKVSMTTALDKELDSVTAEILDGSIEAAFDIDAAKSDTVDLSYPTTQIYVGVAGNVKVDLVGTGTVTFNALPVGFHKICAKRVYVSGTTATNLIGAYHV